MVCPLSSWWTSYPELTYSGDSGSYPHFLRTWLQTVSSSTCFLLHTGWSDSPTAATSPAISATKLLRPSKTPISFHWQPYLPYLLPRVFTAPFAVHSARYMVAAPTQRRHQPPHPATPVPSPHIKRHSRAVASGAANCFAAVRIVLLQ